MTGRKKIGIRDIAAEAGVSTTTVSYVLNGVEGKSISLETRARILEAKKRLNYTPNAAARLLRTGRTGVISVRFTGSLAAVNYGSMVEGIRRCLEKHGYGMLVFTDQGTGDSAEYIEACRSSRADGILYIASDRRDIEPERLAYIRDNGIPLAAIDCMGEDRQISTVLQDYESASSLRLQYLLERGVKRFAYVGGSDQDVKDELRLVGFRRFLDERQLPYRIIRFNTQYRRRRIQEAHFEANFDSPFDARTATELPFHMEREDFRALREIVYDLPADTGILAAYAPMQNAVTQILCARHFTLDRKNEETIPWYELGVSYTFPHYDIGYAAAEALLHVLEGGEPRKLLIPPRVLPVDPAFF